MIETFATDEHRIGLKPILRRIWAPRGQRPVAVGHHRFEWLYVTAFVSPKTGESFWYLSTGVSKRDFEDVLALFAREAGAGRDRIILLVLDNAGWHSPPGLAVPEGIRLVYLPPYTPELQPVETLWVHLDEPVVNKHFDSLGPSSTRSSPASACALPPTETGSGVKPASTGGPIVSSRTDQPEAVSQPPAYRKDYEKVVTVKADGLSLDHGLAGQNASGGRSRNNLARLASGTSRHPERRLRSRG